MDSASPNLEITNDATVRVLDDIPGGLVRSFVAPSADRDFPKAVVDAEGDERNSFLDGSHPFSRDRVMGSLGQRLVAEAVGTFALVFAGCGSIMVDAETHALGHLGVAISFGLVIMIMISALGHISGAHFNPAVTFGFALGRHFPLRLVPAYWLAQLMGAIVAAWTLRGSLGSIGDLGATTPSGSDGQAFVWEAILTAFLVLVVLAVATDTRAQGQLAAIAIGGTVGLDAMFGGPITGASMNPARSLAPALAGGPTSALWVYVAAPLAGAAISTLVYAYLATSKIEES